ncbi:MAG: electron transfer flavoprotein-ubiquinone oxidoreductase [Oxalobacter sp.]|nr:MAG: electron transfer flavoprotein-ubiquinone oxidoreductase [Oxalobacter sp.]
MEYDVLVVGAGAAGLSAAIKLKQMAAHASKDISICVLEKGAAVGAHILSGAIVDPVALTALFPDWQSRGAPLTVPVTEDHFLFLTQNAAMRTPNWALPGVFRNHGNYMASLGELTRWLGQEAEALGVDIFPGFAAAEVLYHNDGSVKGVATGNMGIGHDGTPKASFQLGMEVHAKYTLFAEGARGHLGRTLIKQYQLDAGRDPQAYSLGIKELWEIPGAQHRPGLALHSLGWPLDDKTYGGSFLYHLANNQIAIGYFVGLSYQNPYLSPFEAFQCFKTHPAIRKHLEGGKRIAYGARVVAAGGLQALPELAFPGGALIGCEAGFMNGSRMKGIHTAMQSGILTAEAVFDALTAERANDTLTGYTERFKQSWLHEELYRGRNFKPLMSAGTKLGSLLVGIDQVLLRGRAPWTLHRSRADHETTRPASECQPIAYPKPDNQLTFDLMSSVYLSNTMHEEDQPSHLTLKDATIPVSVNLALYAGLEARYCPAGVYEFVKGADGQNRLQINASNCVHCKTCDIKDPKQNIVWIAPEGGGGPNYPNM